MGNERFNRALRAMKAIGLSTTVVSPVLKHLLKLYGNEWELIEAENYRVLADAVFESQDEEEKEPKKQPKRRRKPNSNNVVESDDENEEELQYQPPLTRARSVVVTRVVHRENSYEADAGFEPVLVEEERTEFELEEPPPSKRKKVESVQDKKGKKIVQEQREHSDKDVNGSGSGGSRGKRIALGPPPVTPRVIKKPKIEMNDVGSEPNNAITCFGTPTLPTTSIVEEGTVVSDTEVQRVSTPEKKPKIKIEQEGCPISTSLPVMNVLPLAAVNTSSISPQQAEYVCDVKGPQRSQEAYEAQGGSAPCSSALGAIADAYMDVDSDDEFSSEFLSSKAKNHLSVMDCDAKVRDLNQPFSHYENDLEGSRHMQLCLEYNNHIEELGYMQPHLAGYNHIGELENQPACLQYKSSLQVTSNGKTNYEYTSGVTEPSIPQLSIDGVLKMVEVYTLQSFRLLAPNFPATKLMEKFCQLFLKSRSNQACIETDSQAVSMPTNLLMSNDKAKIRRSPRTNQKSQEPLAVNKGKEHVDTKGTVPISTTFISLEPCGVDVELSRATHDLNDISRGEEIISIPIVNELSSETSPPRFQYIQKSIVYQSAYVNSSLARIGDDDCCSNCFGNCLESPITCACARETGGEYAYTRNGTLKKDFLEETISLHLKPKQHHYFYCKDCPTERIKNECKPDRCKGHLIRKFIKECWSKCGCNKQCGNRVVQRGINRKLQVFLTPEGKGWGVRTLEEIPRGAFVCEYVGEILTNTELYYRNNERRGNEKHTYPVLLDADWCSEGVLKDEEALCLDATHYGNVARFINHRCYDSNLMEIPVEVESPDRHYYHLAFFTTRKVEALEELTWDYGIDFEDHCHPIKAFQCRCGSGHCRDVKPLT